MSTESALIRDLDLSSDTSCLAAVWTSPNIPNLAIACLVLPVFSVNYFGGIQTIAQNQLKAQLTIKGVESSEGARRRLKREALALCVVVS